MAKKMSREQARSALDKALRAPGRSQTWLAAQLGIGQSAVANWIAGRYRPEHAYRVAIERLLQIPAEAWLTESERETLSRLAKLAPTGT